ncbi:MAG: NAD(P)H-hydrate epimerase [Clostridiales bacterium]|nr:NAD(P)H-hydrate epimerase [Clostridiales bacterium]
MITGTQAKAADRYAMDVMGIPSLTLMENASREVATYIEENHTSEKILILCGTGNNGADGVCIANILNANKKISTAPTVVITGNLEHASWEFLHQLSEYKKAGFTPVFARGNDIFDGCGVLVDAVFGIGLKSELREDKASLLKAADSAGFKHVIAVDMPSGINSDSGELMGAGIHASTTITFGKMKTGLAENSGPEYAGEVLVRDIGIPEEAYIKGC